MKLNLSSEVLMCLYGVMAFTAVCLSIGSVSSCKFLEFTLPGGATPNVGAWRYQNFYYVGVDTSDGTDIYKVESCASNPDSWEMDTKTMSARVFGILAPLLGIVASLLLCVNAKAAAGLFMLTTLFQGLTLLLLKSDLCSPDTYPVFATLNSTTESSIDDCKLGRSGVVSSVATAFFFLSALLALWYDAAKSKEDAEEDGGAVVDTKEAQDEGGAVAAGEGDKADMPEETMAA